MSTVLTVPLLRRKTLENSRINRVSNASSYSVEELHNVHQQASVSRSVSGLSRNRIGHIALKVIVSKILPTMFVCSSMLKECSGQILSNPSRLPD